MSKFNFFTGNREQEQRLRESERLLNLLNDLTLTALESQSLDELLQGFADRLGELINADGCYITRWDERSQTAVPGAAYGPLREVYAAVVPKPGEATLTGHVLQTGKYLVVRDVRETDLLSTRLSSRFPARSQLVLPLIANDEKLGAVLIAFNEVHDFTEQEIERCELISHQVALAILNARHVDALRASEERYRQIFEANLAMKLMIDAETGQVVGANQSACEFYGYTPEEITALNITDINMGERHSVEADLNRAAKGEQNQFSFRHRLASGEMRNVEVFTGPLELNGRTVMYSIIQDVTDRARLEEQLLNAQKMEAIGRVAGGVAHDFNNLLTIILGSFDVLESVSLNDDDREMLERAIDAADRAAALTNQLLAVSRRQSTQATPIDVNELVSGMHTMLKTMVGEGLRIELDLAARQPNVMADRSQLEQVVMNFVINARDAMPRGGVVTVSTRNEPPSPESAEPASFGTEGVVLCVRDEGEGIDERTRPHIFEPFFSTKGQDSTGLGLSTAYGIIKNSGGTIEVVSEPGQGSEFVVRLPAIAEAEAAESAPAPSLTGVDDAVAHTILVAEDNEGILDIAVKTLTRAGYEVISGASGDEALRALDESGKQIDLLLTDVLMPGLSGQQLADEVTARYPDLPVVFMSGYTDDAIAGDLAANAILLSKPFRPSELVRQISAMLEVAQVP